jgi:nucleotide-binding universal stress UspA family protein
MRKKVIIAVDESIHSKHAMEYAVQVAETVREIDFVLIHIQPIISLYLMDEAMKNPKAKVELEKVYQKNREVSQKLLEECKEHMVRKGIDLNCVEIISQIRHHNIAEDILKLAESKPYDAILMGRRGITGLQELIMGSVTSNLLISSHVTPIWVVDGRVRSKEILVAVDGSSQSLRVVDHLSYIFSKNREIQLQFLNVEPWIGDICEINTDPVQTAELERAILDSNKKCITDFSAKAVGILKKAGLAENQISFRKIKKKYFTGNAIIDEAKKGGFGTVVIGKTSTGSKNHLGKVASRIIQKLSDAAVWVVP